MSGDRLRAGGDCHSADSVRYDPQRVEAASASFKGMSSLGEQRPDVMQVTLSKILNQ